MMKLKDISKDTVKSFVSNNTVYIFFVLMLIVCGSTSEYFFKMSNISSLIRQNTSTVVLAMGMLLVLLTGGIDLSVGGVVALCNVVFAKLLMEQGVPVLIAAIVTILIGVLCGAISGYLVAYWKMAPFIVTLAMMQITKSLSFVLTNAIKIRIVNEPLRVIGQGDLFKLGGFAFPNQLVILIIVVALVAFILRRTSYGRLIYAVGSNENAVILSGVNSKIVKASVYAISGGLAAAASLLVLGRLFLATGNLGDGYEMDAIAGCVIGGVALSGGKGSPLKAVLGVFVLALIGNIMNLLHVPAYPQDILQGCIIVAAVLLQDE